MNLLPVIERELRAESRHPTTYWFRSVAAAVILVTAAYILVGRASNVVGTGRDLFSVLHKILFTTIWILVPLMAADCVSREKREQTLGLLFLTPLKAGEIMVAKALVHGLRAAAVCIAVVPPLMLPLLLGGVGWRTVLGSVLINASAFLWALAAGLLASVFSRTVSSGFVWSLLWSTAFLAVLSLMNGFAVFHIVNSMSTVAWSMPSHNWLAGVGLLNLWRPEDSIIYLWRGRLPASTAIPLWLLSGLVILLVSFAGLLLVWRASAWHLKRTWQELPPSPQRQALAREFCEPRIATGFLRARMRRQIDRNPVGWLERRHWTSRTAASGWMAVLTVVYTIAFVNLTSLEQLNQLMPIVVFGLAGALCLSSAASLRRERETGVMELLLTTPLSPEQIVRGRLRGLWSQFLPAGLLFALMTTLLHDKFYGVFSTGDTLMTLWIVAMFYLTIPVVGLWFSLRVRHYVAALILTFAVSVVLPWMSTFMILEYRFMGVNREPWPQFFDLVTACMVYLIGLWGAWKLRVSTGRPPAMIVAAVLFSLIFAIVTDTNRAMMTRGPDGGWIALICGGQQLAIAGFAQWQLLRSLHTRRFAFQV